MSSSSVYKSFGRGSHDSAENDPESNVPLFNENEGGKTPSAGKSPGMVCSRSTMFTIGFVLVSASAFMAYYKSGDILQLSMQASAFDETTISRPVYSTLSSDQQEVLFENFMKQYKKTYQTDEYNKKFTIFQEFLKLADVRNAAEVKEGGSAVHGITMFADMQDDDFTKYLGYDASDEASNAFKVTSVDAYTGSDTSVDWTNIYTTPVKDQGYCSSCWAFAATSQIESDAIRTLDMSTSTSLSVQQLTSCDSDSAGCDGGDIENAFDYVVSNGLVTSTEYAYTSSLGDSRECDATMTDYSVSLRSYAVLSGDDVDSVEENMKNYLLSTGPLTVCLDASGWSTYTSGVIRNCNSILNHCVQVVGVDTDEGYWKIRNSWGPSFGEDGYVRITQGENTCGIASLPMYTVPQEASVSTDSVDSTDSTDSTDDDDDDDEYDDDDYYDNYNDDDDADADTTQETDSTDSADADVTTEDTTGSDEADETDSAISNEEEVSTEEEEVEVSTEEEEEEEVDSISEAVEETDSTNEAGEDASADTTGSADIDTDIDFIFHPNVTFPNGTHNGTTDDIIFVDETPSSYPTYPVPTMYPTDAVPTKR
jgi:C1A family cysteine protease